MKLIVANVIASPRASKINVSGSHYESCVTGITAFVQILV
jgi:hypothetical protein